MSDQMLGKYKILKALGSGATADVYHALDTQLNREVALKILKPSLVADAASFARFTAEAQAAANLFHDHIATVLDMGEMSGRYYIAMKFIPGWPLNEYLQKGPLPWDAALRLAQQVGAALDFAHAQGFLHRDVKPSNIMIGRQGGFVLTDFGLTRAMMSSGLTSTTSALLGTPPYIPPEVWDNQPASAASDQYALACVVYEALTKKILFNGQTPQAIITQHLFKNPDLPTEWPSGVPAGVYQVLLRALSKNPTQRYASCSEFARALAQAPQRAMIPEAPAAISQPPTATPVPLPAGQTSGRASQPPVKPAAVKPRPAQPVRKKRSRWPAVIISLIFLCALIGGVGYLAAKFLMGDSLSSLIPVQEMLGLPSSTAVVEAREQPTTAAIQPTGQPAQPQPTDQPDQAQPTATAIPTQAPAPSDTPLPTPTAAALPVSGRTVGEAFESNGLSLTFVDYNIQSDGRIWLKFNATNNNNSKLLLRYNNNVFTMNDDTGRAYPQDQDHLLNPKQYEMEAGSTLGIQSGSYYDADEYNYIGYFNGIVSESAHVLTIKISQFGDLQNLEWNIPLDPQIAQPQNPAPGAQIEYLQGFSANGISLTLEDYDIRTDGKMWIKFNVRNDGPTRVLMRYLNKYFEIKDDLGTVYEQDKDHLILNKQVLVNPGGAFALQSGSYYDADEYNYFGYFNGMIPEEASAIIVRVAQFCGLQDAQWRIPVNPTLAAPQSPPPGTPVELLQEISANGLSIMLADYSINNDGRIWLKFIVRNNGNNRVLVRYRNQLVTVVDDLGNRYEQDKDHLAVRKQVLMSPGNTLTISSGSYYDADEHNYIGYFNGMIPPTAKSLIVTFEQFMGMTNLQWVITLK